MSYCVNCGVQLDDALVKCPLCNVVVLNPNLIEPTLLLKLIRGCACDNGNNEANTFPSKTGKVEEVKKQDVGLLLSIILGGISFSSLLLNLLIFRETWWSLLIIGICVILFFIMLPAFILTKTPIYIRLLANATTIGLYFYFISLITPNAEWFVGLALPLVALATVIILVIVWLVRFLKTTFFSTALIIITALAFFCVGIELLIKRYNGSDLTLMWSALVLTGCAVIDAGLITVLSRRRLRDDLRKRLHF